MGKLLMIPNAHSHGGSYFIVSLQELDSEGSKLQELLVAGWEPTMDDIITKLGGGGGARV